MRAISMMQLDPKVPIPMLDFADRNIAQYTILNFSNHSFILKISFGQVLGSREVPHVMFKFIVNNHHKSMIREFLL